MALWVLEPGMLATLQDEGRPGYERFGVPPSGAMDWFALRAANLLVGNPAGAAALEFALHGPTLQADRDCLVSVCGSGFRLRIGERDMPAWMAVRVAAGEVLRVASDTSENWGYLAVSGGFAVPKVLGSASTYLRGGFGGLDGRTLQPGDCLRPAVEGAGRVELAGSRLSAGAVPVRLQQAEVRVVTGPQAEWFGEDGLAVFLGQAYRIGVQSDRMGYRLEGPPVPRRQGDLLSEGMAFGSVQVPPDGQPIVMMADRPATGGYPKIATVIRADLPALAQLQAGVGQVRFKAVTLAEAQAAYRAMIQSLQVETDTDELWMTA